MKQVCPHCQQTIVARKESLTKGIIRSLLKCAKTIEKKGLNKIHPRKELKLSISEYNNFQKLRYHGLIAKQDESGFWVITTKGYRFISGKIVTAKYVEVFNNEIVGYSEDLITIADLLKSEAREFPEISTIEYTKKTRKRRVKKRKNPCPSCEDGILKKRAGADFSGNSAANVVVIKYCDRCGYELVK